MYSSNRTLMSFRLKKNPPDAISLRSAKTSRERSDGLHNSRRGMAVRGRRACCCQQFSVNNLGNKPIRDAQQVFICRAALGWVHTAESSIVRQRATA